MSTQQPQPFRTRMFARVLGPFFIIVAATTVARASDMRTLLSDFEASSAWPWVTGAFLLLTSLVIIGLHQYWQGAAAITVSVAGWVLALRAIFLMAFPHAFLSAANAAIGRGPSRRSSRRPSDPAGWWSKPRAFAIASATARSSRTSPR